MNVEVRPQPDAASEPLTLAIDIGGTGLKGAVLNTSGELSTDRVRVPTPEKSTPVNLVEALVELVAKLGHFDRVSVGFPGVIRRGMVLTAPILARTTGEIFRWRRR